MASETQPTSMFEAINPLDTLYRFRLLLALIAITFVAILGTWASGRGLNIINPGYSIIAASLLLTAVLGFRFSLVSTADDSSNTSNDIPGTRLAKVTGLWKFVHKFKGSYVRKLRELHEQHGVIVQIGPHEYSINDPKYARLCKLQKISSSHAFIAQKALVSSQDAFGKLLDMASVFRYEGNLDRCNDALCQALGEYAENEDEINIADLITRFAYDAMFSTSVGKRPGFIDGMCDTSSIARDLKHWKFYSMLSGSYMRFHPIINKLRDFSGISALKRCIFDCLNTINEACIPETQQTQDEPLNTPIHLQSVQDACMALLLAGTDPVIMHLITSIFHIYSNAGLVDNIRAEIETAKLSWPPQIKELIHAKPRMPLLHAGLREALRLSSASIAPPLRYTVPVGGATIEGKSISAGCTICLDPSIVHFISSIFGKDSEGFNASRWLSDPCWLPPRHFIAFGAGDQSCPGENLHYSIVAKVLVQVIKYFDITMAASNSITAPVALTFAELKDRMVAKVALPKNIKLVSDDSAHALNVTVGDYVKRINHAKEFIPNALAHGNSNGIGGSGDEQTTNGTTTSPALSTATTTKSSNASDTPLTWKDEQTLEDVLGRDGTNDLINHFNPSKSLYPRKVFKTAPLINARDRALTHEVIERVWAGGLLHETNGRSKCMFVWVPGSRLPKWLETQHKKRSQNRPDHSTAKDATSKNVASTTGPAHRTASTVPRDFNPGWVNFAVDAHTGYGKVPVKHNDENAVTHLSEQVKKEYAVSFKQEFVADSGVEGTANPVTNAAESGMESASEATTVPKKTIPPHLRARMANGSA